MELEVINSIYIRLSLDNTQYMTYLCRDLLCINPETFISVYIKFCALMSGVGSLFQV